MRPDLIINGIDFNHRLDDAAQHVKNIIDYRVTGHGHLLDGIKMKTYFDLAYVYMHWPNMDAYERLKSIGIKGLKLKNPYTVGTILDKSNLCI